MPPAIPMRDATLWPDARVTGNCHILTGYIAACMMEPGKDGKPRMYRPQMLTAPLIVEHVENGNLYRVTVEQISGKE